MRANAEIVLNEAGRSVLAGLCGVEPAVLARALPAFTLDDPKISTGREAGLAQARWRSAGAVAGETAFACRLCTARRTGQTVRAVRYLPRWQRVCVRHGRWLLDAGADQPLEHLDLRGVPEVAAAQRRWAGVARRAGRVPPGWLTAMKTAQCNQDHDCLSEASRALSALSHTSSSSKTVLPTTPAAALMPHRSPPHHHTYLTSTDSLRLIHPAIANPSTITGFRNDQ
ncbi:hypothetical protein [Streptomyces sp. NPDC002250]|uniref:hypothetical protein n=1 Tax=Streptomyces sp. NPDC002250 TaxID=3364641 RepID=UPI0036B994A0